MANIRELHYAFDLHLDRISSQAKPDLNVAEKDWLLNEAQLLLVKNFFDPQPSIHPRQTRRRGFETSERRAQDLSTLVVKYPLQPAIVPIDQGGVSEVPLNSTAYPFLFLVSAQAITSQDGCNYTVPLKFTQHDDLSDVLRDPFNSPSTEYLPYNVGMSFNGNAQSMYIYPGTTSIQEVHLHYVRAPKKVSFGTYAYIDGVTYPEQTLEVPEHLHSEVLDLACQLAALATDNPEYVQLRTIKSSLNEQN
jgi:hypothetical protein